MNNSSELLYEANHKIIPPDTKLQNLNEGRNLHLKSLPRFPINVMKIIIEISFDVSLLVHLLNLFHPYIYIYICM